MGCDAILQTRDKSGIVERIILGRSRVFWSAYCDRKVKTDAEMIGLLHKCVNDAFADYEENGVIEELLFRFYWIKECLTIILKKGDIEYSLNPDTVEENVFEDHP
jgi:hypothetical protein